MCGIVGLHLSDETQSTGLTLLHGLHKSIRVIQHRGYDGAGVAWRARGRPSGLKILKARGMIDTVFENLFFKEEEEKGDPSCNARQGVAHTRYRTIGDCKSESAQPLLSKDRNLCMAHNGQVEAPGYFPDSQCILDLFEKEYQVQCQNNGSTEAIFAAVNLLFKTLKGSYSCVMLVEDQGLLAFRDPRGIRPLLLGRTEKGDTLIASESVCHDAFLASLLTDTSDWKTFRDIDPGEVIFVDQRTGHMESRHLLPKETVPDRLLPCLFEYIYLASPNSILDGLLVSKARRGMGRLLARQLKRDHSDICQQIDLVVPIPETSCLAARALAESLNIEYLHLLELNPLRGQARSFILPTQEERVRAVSEKFLLPVPGAPDLDLRGRNILLVDDSIVRGTTLGHLVQTIRRTCQNPGKIYVASIAPPVRTKNQYGIDIPTSELLIAKGRSPREIAQCLEADGIIIYQDLSELIQYLASISPRAENFEKSMFEEK